MNDKLDILIVDDLPDNLRVLSVFLLEANYQVRKAISGEMALKAVKANLPDLILLDINMPDMSGYEVCKKLKEDPDTCDIPVIFLSALNGVVDKVLAFDVGGVDYIQKPFQPQEVLARVKTHLTIHWQKKQLEEQNIFLRNANQELERLAIIDSLTQIANRRRFDQYLEQQWKVCQREQNSLSLIMGDVDFFKKYNDFYGHPEGDQCLAKIAQAMLYIVKRPRDLVARYGGEEFVIILPNTDLDGAIKIAQNICKKVHSLKIAHSGSEISQYVTLSLGVANVIPKQQLVPELLIKAADKALYHAKKIGRNRVCFTRKIMAITKPNDEI